MLTFDKIKKTPRTNSETYVTYSSGNYDMGEDYGEKVVDVEFARHLEKENQILRDALEFYANPENWKKVYTGIGEVDGDAIDYGVRAESVLKYVQDNYDKY